jgi:hypothetical protein
MNYTALDIVSLEYDEGIGEGIFIIVCQSVKNTHSNGIIKLLDLSYAY